MPDAKNNAKLTGDTHPPEVEDLGRARRAGQPRAGGTDGTPTDDALTRDTKTEHRPRKKAKQAGHRKDKGGDVDNPKA